MNGQLPSNPSDILEFVTGRIDKWQANHAELGVSEALVEAALEALEAAQAAQLAAEAARIAALTATAAFHDKARKLREAAAKIVRQSQATAANSGDTEVYALAGLNIPKKPIGWRGRESRVPSPAVDLRASLDAPTGAIALTWKSRQPRGIEGVTYEVRRSVDDAPGGTHAPIVGFSGGTEKVFVDEGVPAGSRKVSYVVTPIVGGKRGRASEMITVKLGAAAPAPAGAAGATGGGGREAPREGRMLAAA